MKKPIFFSIIFLIVCVSISSADTRRVEWQQDQATVDVMEQWELSWSDTSGGPYSRITYIQKPIEPPQGGIYVLPEIELQVTGALGTTVTKYFVIRALMPSGVASDWSEEASSDFLIAPGVPFSLRVIVETIPE